MAGDTTSEGTPDEFRTRYFEAVGLNGDSDKRRVNALKRAHELRAFEIDLYWKRATYVWAFQGAAFAALALSIRNEEMVTVVSAFGAITAYAALLTARGSKFWQENWEGHVDQLEEHEQGRLTQTVVVRGDVGRSVSRVNERLIRLLLCGWSITLFCSLLFHLWPGRLRLEPPVSSLLTAATFVAGMLYLGIGTRSRLDGSKWAPGDRNWQPHGPKRQRRHWLIWRGYDAPDVQQDPTR